MSVTQFIGVGQIAMAVNETHSGERGKGGNEVLSEILSNTTLIKIVQNQT